MARPLRLESEGNVYHVINWGNDRAALFRGTKTREMFLECVHEACVRTGWRVHAWCVMPNHYHLALSTPKANLVEGMHWLQARFASRYNELRPRGGRVFQDRYKSLVVEPEGSLGPLCHFIHLNPVRARLCSVQELPQQPWTSLAWLMDPKQRPAWYDPSGALSHAGDLADASAGRRQYLKYLTWLSGNEAARQEQRFAKMSKGWSVGSKAFAKALVREQQKAVGKGTRLAAKVQEGREAVWEEILGLLLRKLRRKREDLTTAGKSADWKLALAAALKARTTATNRWLAVTLQMGNLHEVSRKVSSWTRKPDPVLLKKLQLAPNPKA